MPKKKNKTYGRVDYACNLSSNSWFGSYECRVNKVFLDRPGVEIRTKQFQAAGYTWQLLLCHKDGNLAAYLYSQNPSTVKVHFSFTVVNREQKKNELWGDVRSIKPSEKWGEPNLMPIASIKDNRGGFLFEDSFIVTLDLRMKGQFNETRSLSADGKRSGTYVWKLKHLCGMSPPVVLSDEFTACGLKWALEVYPHEICQAKEYVSFYIYSYNHSPVQAEVTLTAINDADPARNIMCTDEYVFGTYGEEYGCSKFIETRVFEDGNRGFLKDGWITLTAHISIPGPAKNTPIRQAVNQMERLKIAEEPECIFCMDKPQTSGVLHGNTTHKCYCLDCARFMKQRQKDLYCPICRQKVERIIEKFY